MKSLAYIFLTLWLSFLSAPTVITVVAEKDISALNFSFSEEEKETEQKVFEESFKEFLLNTSFADLLLLAKQSEKLKSGHNERFMTEFKEIFSPPPEMV